MTHQLVKRFFILPLVKQAFLAVTLFLIGLQAQGQELPIFNPKLTNSFLYNPALAGYASGSILFLNKQNWSNTAGAPSTNLLSFDIPIYEGKAGAGLNLFTDNTNIFKTVYASGAFAYHITWNEYKRLSMGVSTEMSNTKLDPLAVNIPTDDPLITKYAGESETNYDFSFGINLKTKYLTVGGALNRLSSSFITGQGMSLLQHYFTSYLNGTLPMAHNRDLLEPLLTYRQLSGGNAPGQIDGGLYYTFNDMLTMGVSYGSESAGSVHAGFRFQKIYLSYTREAFAGKTIKTVGASNEFMFRLDFSREDGYKNKFRSKLQKTKSAVAFRRKSLSKGPVGTKSPEKFMKKWKKKGNSQFNPNKRYNGSKLNSVKYHGPKRKKRHRSHRRKHH